MAAKEFTCVARATEFIISCVRDLKCISLRWVKIMAEPLVITIGYLPVDPRDGLSDE